MFCGLVEGTSDATRTSMCAQVIEEDDEFLAADSPRRAHVLVAIGFRDPAMARIGVHICKQLSSDGHVAELGNVDAHAMPAPPDYDMIVIGMTGRRMRDRNMRHWLELYQPEISDIPSAVFVVGTRAALSRTITRVLREVDLLPALFDVFAVDDDYVASQFASRVAQLVRTPPRGSDLATQYVGENGR
jgi:menaquinone-dependent protoporphyrinogen IX oxidase